MPIWFKRHLPSLFALGILGLSAFAIFYRQWLSGDVFVGNFDRLNGGSLPLRLLEARQIQDGSSISNWTDTFFMGTNVGGLGGMNLGWSPLSWLYAQVPPSSFLAFAAWVAAGLWLLAAIGTFVFLRRIGMGRIASTTGALCYACSTLITIRLSQGDSLMYNFALFPWLHALVASANRIRPAVLLASQGSLLFIIFNASLLQESAYFSLALGAFALLEARVQRSWRPVALLLVAATCAVLAAMPRVMEAQNDLRQVQRTQSGRATPATDFEATYAQQHLTSREGLRFIHDGIFGRNPAEAREIGNNINLNEGFQVYASTFASLTVLLGLAALIWPATGAQRSPDRRYLWLAAGLAAGISLIVLNKEGLRLVYNLFFRIDFSHGRLVSAALLPLALLAASAIDRLLTGPGRFGFPGSLTRVLVAAVLATAVLAGLNRIESHAFEPTRLDLSTPSLRQASTMVQLIAGRTPVVEAPAGGVARWIEPGTAALAWEQVFDATVEVEMQQDDSAFRVMGRNEANRYHIGSIQPDGNYGFRLRSWRGDRASAYSPVFRVEALAPGSEFEKVAPPVASGEKTWMLTRAVVYALAASGVFGVWLFAIARCRYRPEWRHTLALGLCFAIGGEAVWRLTHRLNGPETRTYPQPFANDNLFNSPAGTLRPPAAEARAQLHARLERDRFRTLLLEPSSQFYSASLHVPVGWDLRTPQGAWSGVPRRIAALPWPAEVVSMRRLIFRTDTDLPWDLLAKLNVKYVLTVDISLYFNTWPEGPTAEDLARMRIVENPRFVVPREFFVSRTLPAPALEGPGTGSAVLPENPLIESTVEGLTGAAVWSTEGSIHATYAGDRVTINLDPSPSSRFLVLNELYHPDWHAFTDDGRSLKVHPANTVMRGLEIPAGATRVWMEFRPPPGVFWRTGAPVIATILLLVACWLAERRRLNLHG